MTCLELKPVDNMFIFAKLTKIVETLPIFPLLYISHNRETTPKSEFERLRSLLLDCSSPQNGPGHRCPNFSV